MQPRTVRLSKEAKEVYRQLHDDIESKLGPGEIYYSVSGFANKVPEHACRLATVMEFIENPEVTELSAEALQRGVEVALYHLRETVRLMGNSSLPDEQGRHLDELKNFLLKSWNEDHICLTNLLQQGPHYFRGKGDLLLEQMKLLEAMGIVTRYLGPREILGRRRIKNIWKIHSDNNEDNEE